MARTTTRDLIPTAPIRRLTEPLERFLHVEAAGGIVLASTVAAQVAIPPHGYFGLDELFGFNAGFGLLTCIAMVLFAKAMGFLLKRKDTYYDD